MNYCIYNILPVAIMLGLSGAYSMDLKTVMEFQYKLGLGVDQEQVMRLQLNSAIAKIQPDQVKKLLNERTDCLQPDENGWTPVHEAAQCMIRCNRQPTECLAILQMVINAATQKKMGGLLPIKQRFKRYIPQTKAIIITVLCMHRRKGTVFNSVPKEVIIDGLLPYVLYNELINIEKKEVLMQKGKNTKYSKDAITALELVKRMTEFQGCDSTIVEYKRYLEAL